MYFDGYDYDGESFDQVYRCYSASFVDQLHIENGDKVIMPPSALGRLASLDIDYPMMFELQNSATERDSHCGVLEFTAEEGMIYMPYWMMENLVLEEGQFVCVKNVSLPNGTYVKLQPHTKDFLDISNPKAILEKTLRNFSCLSTGDCIMVAHNDKKYYINIVETKPTNAISIIETDCEVDFAPPLDYIEPETTQSKRSAEVQEPSAETEPKSSLFMGSGRRLDGKPLTNHASSSGSEDKKSSAASTSGSSNSQSTSRRSQGKLVFGSNTNHNSQASLKVGISKGAKEEGSKKKDTKFQAFTGKKYSLI